MYCTGRDLLFGGLQYLYMVPAQIYSMHVSIPCLFCACLFFLIDCHLLICSLSLVTIYIVHVPGTCTCTCSTKCDTSTTVSNLSILAIWRKSGMKSGAKGRGFYSTARTMHVLATPYKSRGIVFLPLLSNLGIMASKNPQIGVELSRGNTGTVHVPR